MDNTIQLIHPGTFEEGLPYLFLERHSDSRPPSRMPVTFVMYDPCPALIIVSDEFGIKRRCPREDIYIQVQVV
jgi:hypothetical protein